MTTLVAPPLWTVGPFILMLLAIAIGPLAVPHWWESNRNKLVVAAVLGAPILMLYLRWRPAAILATAEEYVSFIVLLGGLYVISGGILLRGDLEATPLTNATFLAVGTAIASFIGTTGASMLLIRALLQTNRERQQVRPCTRARRRRRGAGIARRSSRCASVARSTVWDSVSSFSPLPSSTRRGASWPS